MAMEDDSDDQMDMLSSEPDEAATGPASEDDKEKRESDVRLAARIVKTIRDDKKFHDKAFKRMQRDMQVAMHGHEKDWSEKNYKANITGRHVKQKTAALYAKNPKAVARRRETLDFAIWDETPESLQLAFMQIQQAAQATALAAQTPPTVSQDPLTGAVVEVPAQPQIPPGFAEAQALVADFQQGFARRQQLKKFGRTLEILFAQALREQQPVDFKTAMKQLVRRGCTTGVGYVELGFQREYGPAPETVATLTDARTRIEHLRRLSEEAAEGEIEEMDGEMAELERSVASLQQEEEILLREGLIFDFPASTKVIPDRLCKSLVGFIGARHVTIEYLYTRDEIKERFGVEIGSNYVPYSVEGLRQSGGLADDDGQVEFDLNDDSSNRKRGGDLVCVWKHYDKPSGLVYIVCDGYKGFLRDPAPPDVFVSDFWPLYALTFNAVESEDELFPPSDVTLLLDMQREYNRSRQGLREHRDAARPRWIYTNGTFDEEAIPDFQKLKPFEALGVDKDPATKISDVLETIPVPGVDPNLYETAQLFKDMQLVAGTQEAQLGGLSKTTATESAIAADSSATSDGSSIDDLDGFLSRVSRASGQILFREMTPEQVTKLVGPGAVWPDDLTLANIADEVFLEVEAGSTGKPNQAIEIRNWKEMLPFLIQMGNIPGPWLARESLRRLDDRLDLTEAVAAGIPSIVAQNQNAQPATGNAATDPASQGPAGASNGPAPPGGPVGTGPAFGNNQM